MRIEDVVNALSDIVVMSGREHDMIVYREATKVEAQMVGEKARAQVEQHYPTGQMRTRWYVPVTNISVRPQDDDIPGVFFE